MSNESTRKPPIDRRMVEELRAHLVDLERDADAKGVVSVVDTIAIIATLSAILDDVSPFNSRQDEQMRRARLVLARAPFSYGTFDLRWWPKDLPEPAWPK